MQEQDHQAITDDQDEAEQEERRPPETAREAAKDFIRPYVLDGWKIEELTKKRPGTNREEYAARIGGGQIIDYRNQEHTVTPQQIAVTLVGGAPCWGLFDLAHIMAEIRDEARGYKQQTLADVFMQQEQERVARTEREDAEIWQAIAPSQPPAPKKTPAVFRSYNGGSCQNPKCSEWLGYIEADGGRDRLYCSDRCRVSHYRQRKREAQRQQVLQYNSELREYWKLHGVHGEVLLRLQEILLQYGKKAAKAATDAVLVALEAAEQAGSNEQMRLIEECMLGGESIGFEEIILEELRIPAGFGGWSEFVSYASNNLLRQLRGYLYDRQRQEYQKAQGRKRLEALSRDHAPQE